MTTTPGSISFEHCGCIGDAIASHRGRFEHHRKHARFLPICLALLALSMLMAKGQSLLFQGLTNNSVGNASLVISSDQLEISNLGSSGQDGVDLQLNSTGDFVLNTFYET